MSRRDPLAAHVRRLGNHDLNELLVQLPKPTFAALVDVALARPVLPAGLLLRYEPANGVDGWTVVACAPRRRLGTLTRDRDPGGQLAWRAWTRAGDPVQVAGIAAGGVAGMRPRPWPGSPRPAGPVGWPWPPMSAAWPTAELHELLRALPCEVFDGLLEAAFAPEGTAA